MGGWTSSSLKIRAQVRCKKINHPIKKPPNNKVDQYAVAEVIELASKKHFTLVDKYVKEKNLTGREKTLNKSVIK